MNHRLSKTRRAGARPVDWAALGQAGDTLTDWLLVAGAALLVMALILGGWL